MTRDLAAPFVRGLRDAGVQMIFGMPGGGANLDVIGCAEDEGIDFVLAHGETAACIMAGSYGHLTGTPGVAVVTRGPGLASAVNGLAQATLDRYPLLLVSDTVSQADAVRVAHQRVDQVATAAPVTKFSGVLGARDPEGVAGAAARLALDAPAGAVHLTFDATADGDEPPAPPTRTASEDSRLDEVRRLVAAARRPVVIVGLDAARHPDAVRKALTSLECPVLVTYQAKGTVPESWSTYAGLFTGASLERPVLEQADLVLAVGLDPVEPTPTPWSYGASTVMVHSHDVDTTYFGDATLVTGPYEEILDGIVAGCAPGWGPDAGRQAHHEALERLDHRADGLGPHDVVRETQRARPGALLTVDAGAHMLVAMPLWETDEANSVLISNGLATMGFSLPAAIGAALAHPGRRVVCLVGDGGLGMVLAELETLARLRLDVTVVVLNDEALTLIRLKQKADHGGDRAVTYQTTDFAAIARAMGVRGTTAEDADQLRTALERGEPGPELVDARIDPSAYTHVMRTIRG
jgi:acetolactate synthase-1/2/3 large subunit